MNEPRPGHIQLDRDKLARFLALPDDEQVFRLARADELHRRIESVGRWFDGLLVIVVVLIIAQIASLGRFLFPLVGTTFAFLLVLQIYVSYRGRLIIQANRYLDPDWPATMDSSHA